MNLLEKKTFWLQKDPKTNSIFFKIINLPKETQNQILEGDNKILIFIYLLLSHLWKSVSTFKFTSYKNLTNLLIQQTPKPEAQFPDATAIVSPLFEHSSAVTQIPDIAGVEIVVHSSLGNVTTENKPRTSRYKNKVLSLS